MSIAGKRLEVMNQITQSREELAKGLAYSGTFIARINDDINKHASEFVDYANREVACLIDYLASYLVDGNEDFRPLYIGERLKMSYDINISAQERNDRLVEFMKRDKAVFLNGLGEVGGLNEQVEFFFEEIIAEFSVPIEKELKVLFIGDCLHQDVMGTLSVLIAKYGFSISPYMVSTKNAFQVHKELKTIGEQKFDAIFFSPLSYEYNLEFSALLHRRNFFLNGFEFAEKLIAIMDGVESVVDVLLTYFDCPIFIHNTIAPIRDESKAKLLLKSLLVHRMRKRAVQYIDKRLKGFIAERNKMKFKQLFLIDELQLLEQHKFHELGVFIYRSALQHPTMLGILLAERYGVLLNAIGRFVKKKVIVCDLDNTLWNGVIGEGAVSHYLDRQEVLLKLKSKGVLLAINSKNDPKNVHWDGGRLDDDDFVYKAISWAPKINAFSEMKEALNLKIDSFIFIDDRPDELEMVRSQYPGIECLDATDAATWGLLELWNELLSDDDKDRTQLYKERASRGDFIKTSHSNVQDEASAFKALNLMVVLKTITVGDIKRTVELVNRTNQFNMRGSRTSFSEVETWLKSEDVVVMQASMSDKFGDMGVVSIIVYEYRSDGTVFIPIFVLSCRVFGYQVEFAILNELKRQAIGRNVNAIRGEFIPTDSNAPCSSVYLDAGFAKSGDSWSFKASGDVTIKEPKWLEVSVA
jgi:FkbH-like protein